MAETPVMTDPYTQTANRLKTLTKVMTTKAPIAQTPKELVWTLNKAKLLSLHARSAAERNAIRCRCCWSSR